MKRPGRARTAELLVLLGAALLLGASGAVRSTPEVTRESQASGVTLWSQVDRGPAVRTGPAMAYGGHGVTVLFGGAASGTLLGDTWGWDGAHWTLLSDVGPGPRTGAAFVYDAARQRGLLVGGESAAGASEDTWEWSGTAWTNVTPIRGGASVGPSARAGAAMAFDSARKRAVLFGGTADSAGETWEWDGDAWTLACVGPPCNEAKPPPRSYAAATFDEARGRVVLFGGSAPGDGGEVPLGDTWEWDGTAWTPGCTSGACSASRPPSRSSPSFVYDAATRTSVLFGGAGDHATLLGDTWVWDGASWSSACTSGCVPAPRPQSGQGMAYDPARGRVVLQGTGGKPDGETWEWDGSKWAQWAQQSAPQPFLRDGHAMAFDQTRGRVVLFGGFVSATSVHTFGDTWEWDGYEWVPLCGDGSLPGAPSCGVPPRFAHALAFDATRSRTVLFGGLTPAPGGTYAPLQDTWQWNGAQWAEAFPSVTPEARYAHALAYDSQRAVTVLFGGQGASVLESDTWEWDGSIWSARQTPRAETPPPRSHHAMAYDPVRRTTVLFGGLGGGDVPLGDTWEWDGARWQERLPYASPPRRVDGALAYDPTTARIVLFGGESGSVNDSDTWEWDGTIWTLQAEATSPPARTAHAVAYDGANRRLLLYAGFGDTQYLSDTWARDHRGGGCDAGDACGTARCVDGVCCKASCGACEACDLAIPGVCLPLLGAPVVGTEDPGGCDGNRACDAHARCRLKVGVACAADAECVSDHCVDGVCCDGACSSRCTACSAKGKASGSDDGICGNAAAGARDPRGTCGKEEACTCGFDGRCDGLGGCSKFIEGTPCGCSGEGGSPSGDECDGRGTCHNTGSVVCAGDHLAVLADAGAQDCHLFRCVSGTGCLTRCSSNADCSGANVCGVERVCSPPPSASSQGAPGGCAVARPRGTGDETGAFVLGLAAASWLRSRRRRRT